MGQGYGVSISWGVGRTHGSDPLLLWLWCRPAAVASIRPLAWESPCAAGVALKRPKIKIKSGDFYLKIKTPSFTQKWGKKGPHSYRVVAARK